MADAFKVDFDAAGLIAELDELSGGIQELARPAAQAGAQVFYDEVRRFVPVSKEARKYKGKVYQPGTLLRAIYQAYSADNSRAGVATYHISWNAKKAPHGHLIENGHWTKVAGKYGPLQPRFVPAHPFIRPAFDAAQGRAVAAVEAELSEGAHRILSGAK